MNVTLLNRGGGGRLDFVDLAKGLCMILVVIDHSRVYYGYSFPLNDAFTSFEMPLYFFLSGLFYNPATDFRTFIKKKINGLIIPFIFFYISLCWLVPNIVRSTIGLNGNLLQEGWWNSLVAVFTNKDYPHRAVWFLLCLFDINLLFFIVNKISMKIRNSSISIFLIVVVTIFLGYLGWLCCKHDIILPLYLGSALSSLPFFCVANLFSRKTNVLKSNKMDRFNWLIIVACFAVVILYGHEVFLFKNKYDNPITMYLFGFIGSIGFFLLSKQLSVLPLINFFGRYSLMILVTHQINIRIISTIIKLNGMIGFYLCIMLVMLSYILIIPLMKKFFPHVTGIKPILK